MKVLIAPDKFKGALSAAGAAAAIATGVASIDPAGADRRLSDGRWRRGNRRGISRGHWRAAGEGCRVRDRCSAMSVKAEYGILGDGTTAVIEMAAASGLALLSTRKRNPLSQRLSARDS